MQSFPESINETHGWNCVSPRCQVLLQYPAFGRLSSKDVQGRKPVERAFREGRFETSLLDVRKLDGWIVDETCCSVKWARVKGETDSYRSQAFTESCSIEEMFKEPNLGGCIRSQHLFWEVDLTFFSLELKEPNRNLRGSQTDLDLFGSICQLPQIVLWWKPISAD